MAEAKNEPAAPADAVTAATAITGPESLSRCLARIREAQKTYANFSQERVDKIFFAAARADYTGAPKNFEEFAAMCKKDNDGNNKFYSGQAFAY